MKYLHIFIFTLLATLGLLWFFEGKSSVYLQFSLNGLLVIFNAIFFGLLPLIPRLYFLFTDQKKINRYRPEKEALYPKIYLILVVFSLSFSLGVDKVERHHQTQKDELIMAYGQSYTFSKDDRGSDDSTVTLIIIPPEDGIIVFESYKCGVQFTDAKDNRVTTFTRQELAEIDLTSSGDIRLWAFNAKQNERYFAKMKIDFCTADYRLYKGKKDE